ncbi:MAG: hypothetical protein WC782_14910 [Methylococcaceae bacterium]|jgi:hypothetical protein
MNAATLSKVLRPKASDICQDIEQDAQALASLALDMSPVSYLNALLAMSLYPDAVRFLARALPKREAVWWACLCTRSSLGHNARAEVSGALAAAEAWVYEPSENMRRSAYKAAVMASFDNPAAWAAMAAFWSEGSMTPEELPAVPVIDNLNAKAVAGAVMLSAVQGAAEQIQDKYPFFIEQGIDIANGGNGKLWAI